MDVKCSHVLDEEKCDYVHIWLHHITRQDCRNVGCEDVLTVKIPGWKLKLHVQRSHPELFLAVPSSDDRVQLSTNYIGVNKQKDEFVQQNANRIEYEFDPDCEHFDNDRHIPYDYDYDEPAPKRTTGLNFREHEKRNNQKPEKSFEKFGNHGNQKLEKRAPKPNTPPPATLTSGKQSGLIDRVIESTKTIMYEMIAIVVDYAVQKPETIAPFVEHRDMKLGMGGCQQKRGLERPVILADGDVYHALACCAPVVGTTGYCSRHQPTGDPKRRHPK
jgi:hypothetical protein